MDKKKEIIERLQRHSKFIKEMTTQNLTWHEALVLLKDKFNWRR